MPYTPSEAIGLLEKHFALVKQSLAPQQQEDKPIEQMKKRFVLNEAQFKDVMGNMRELQEAIDAADKTLAELDKKPRSSDSNLRQENKKLRDEQQGYRDKLVSKFEEFTIAIATDLKHKKTYIENSDFPKYFHTAVKYYNNCTYHLHISDKKFDNDETFKLKQQQLNENFESFKSLFAERLEIKTLSDQISEKVDKFAANVDNAFKELGHLVQGALEEKREPMDQTKKRLRQNKFQIGNPSRADEEEIEVEQSISFAAFTSTALNEDVNAFEVSLNKWMNSNESLANHIDLLNEKAARLDAENRKIASLKARYKAERVKLEGKNIAERVYDFFNIGEEIPVQIDVSDGNFFKRYNAAIKKLKTEGITLAHHLTELEQFNQFIDELEGRNSKDSQPKNIFDRIKDRDREFVQKVMHFNYEPEISLEHNEIANKLDAFYQDPVVQKELTDAIQASLISRVVKFFGFNISFGANKAAEATRNAFGEELKSYGLVGDQYEKLIDPIEKLFIFRCFALGEENAVPDKTKFPKLANLREDLLRPPPKDLNQKQLNAIIHQHYLKRLLDDCDQAFHDIYTIHSAEMKNDEEMAPISKFITQFFQDIFDKSSNEKRREVFTQQMMINFLSSYIDNLTNKLHEQVDKPYLFKRIFFSGLFIAVAVSAVMYPLGAAIASIGLTFAAIALVSVAVAYVFNKFVTKKVDKHSEESKAGINEAITIAKTHKQRLEAMIQEAKATTVEDVKKAEEVKELNDPSNPFTAILDSIKGTDKTFPIGSARAWEAEYLSRYRHSLRIESDLQPQFLDIIDQAKQQTRKMQICLMQILKPEINSKLKINQDVLNNYIDKGNKFIAAHGDQYQNFEFKQKIKEQILEIVAAIPESMGKLPDKLTAFYIQLGGLSEDLILARQLSFVDKTYEAKKEEIKAEIKTEEKKEEFVRPPNSVEIDQESVAPVQEPVQHPLPKAIGNLDLLMNQSKKKLFRGDAEYRRVFGLTTLKDFPLNATNVNAYLEDSFNFLNSLKKPTPTPWGVPYEHSHEYMLYQTLLMKQLAELVTPDNRGLSQDVKQKIIDYMQTSFPEEDIKAIFRQVRTQALLPKDQKKSSYWDIAAAIRVGLCYNLKPMTPESLMNQQCQGRPWFDNKQIFLLNKQLMKDLDPPAGISDYQERVDTAIQETETFLKELHELEKDKGFSVSAAFLDEAGLKSSNIGDTSNSGPSQFKR